MSLHYGLLGLLNYGEATGYDLKKAFDESLNFFWQAHKSQIYKELSAMEKQGLLSVNVVIQEDKPNKKIYAITEQGRKELLDWLADDLKGEDFVIRDAFLMKVFFLGEVPQDSAIEKLNAFANLHRRKLERYQAIAGSVDAYSSVAEPQKVRFWSLTARHGFAYSETCIAWAEEAISIIQSESNKGVTDGQDIGS